MKRAKKSLGFAIEGLRHAVNTERNLRWFLLGHLGVCALFLLSGDVLSVIVMSCVAGFFIVVELLNTALERLADTFDDCEKQSQCGHFHPGIKMTKDVAAGAALIAFMLYLAVLSILLALSLLEYYFMTLD